MTFEDDLLALERRVLEQAGGDFFRAVEALRKLLAAEDPGLGRALIRLAIPQLEQAATAAVLDAHLLGATRALETASSARHVTPAALEGATVAVRTPPAHLTEPLAGLDARLAEAKAKAAKLLRAGVDPKVAAAPIFEAATSARSRIVTQVNDAANTAAQTVGVETSSPMVWEAERDACVYCLALAGEVVEAGETFPVADLYAPVPPSLEETGEHPPLHPHCRCTLAVLADPAYAAALKREAQRSILRGHSLPSESEAVRIRAAARLLERDPVAPKSVKAYAAAAIKRGRFPTRSVPTGGPRLVEDGPGSTGNG